MAIELVDFPINRMVIFYSYVNVCQRVTQQFERLRPLQNFPGRNQSFTTSLNHKKIRVSLFNLVSTSFGMRVEASLPMKKLEFNRP